MKKLKYIAGPVVLIPTLVNANLDSANFLAEKNIIVDQRLSPEKYFLNKNILRQEIAWIVEKMLNLPAKTTCENLFSDVKISQNNSWACPRIENLLQNGIIAWNLRYNPESYVTKAEAVGFILKAIYKDEYEKYSRNQNWPWEEKAVKFALEKGILKESFNDFSSFAKRWFIFEIMQKAIENSQKNEIKNENLQKKSPKKFTRDGKWGDGGEYSQFNSKNESDNGAKKVENIDEKYMKMARDWLETIRGKYETEQQIVTEAVKHFNDEVSGFATSKVMQILKNDKSYLKKKAAMDTKTRIEMEIQKTNDHNFTLDTTNAEVFNRHKELIWVSNEQAARQWLNTVNWVYSSNNEIMIAAKNHFGENPWVLLKVQELINKYDYLKRTSSNRVDWEWSWDWIDQMVQETERNKTRNSYNSFIKIWRAKWYSDREIVDLTIEINWRNSNFTKAIWEILWINNY